jgi:hypothetical protein
MSAMDKLIWSIGGMTVTRQNWCIRIKTCPSFTLSTINPIQTKLESKSDLGIGKPSDKPPKPRHDAACILHYCTTATFSLQQGDGTRYRSDMSTDRQKRPSGRCRTGKISCHSQNNRSQIYRSFNLRPVHYTSAYIF